MKRLSLILSIFLLVVVLVSCGTTARTTSSRNSRPLSPVEQFEPAEPERLYGEVEDHGAFVLVKPRSEIVGADPQGHTAGSGINYSGVFIPGRTVKLSPYYIGKYEVTYKLWKEVYDWAVGKGYTFRNSGKKGSHDSAIDIEPVTEIDWLDCIIWCNAYTEMTKGSTEQCVYLTGENGEVLKSASSPSEVYFDQDKKGYRLPTEAEWEYAARFQGSDSTNALQYGNTYLTHLDSLSGAKAKYTDTTESQRVAWYRENSGGKTQPVGQKAPNYAGIYDMSGNVCEWCYDGWQDPLSTGTQTNPVGASSVDNRVVRGGSWSVSWYYNAYICVVGYRNYWWFYYRDVSLGFRVSYSQ